ncbi:BTAD domain-containing putative transcriptional regulator [Micromonospora sp. NPDC048947]|uniref:AfsR/SARP family transcriptional regulator n=1 Tax=Micromonospora sp. NPDC048947 TaxID=3154826 RepID=UPI0033CCF859
MESERGSKDLQIALLGPVRLWRAGVELPAGPPQRRSVLALLGLAEGRMVGLGEIVDALWPEGPPRRALNIIQTHVKHLRRMLEPDRPPREASHRLPFVGSGYRLDVDSAAIDLLEFRRLVSDALTARSDGDQARVWELTGKALRLWQPPAADLPALTGNPKVAALDIEAQLLLSWRVDAAILEGRAEEVLAAVRKQAHDRPLDEHSQVHLMRCYFALGRRADAFAVFDKARKLLVSELGVHPGAGLVDAYHELLESERPADEQLRAAPASPVTVASPALGNPPRWPLLPAQLPPDVVHFTGRAEQLSWLDGLVAVLENRCGTVTITGTAGAGKTTLAVHWAHRASKWFPDGQLFADLEGFGASGGLVGPDEVVRGFLTALGVASDRIPVDLSARIGLYRSLLAGRRMLILLDNVRRADQVGSLIPGSAGCMVLITSRNELPALVMNGGRPLVLGLMNDAEARQLFTSRIGAERLTGGSEVIDQLVATCAGLPLALAILAARASTQPQLSLSALADQLRQGSDDLAAFADEDGAFDVRTVFSWSYRILPAQAAELFRLLGLHPGPEISLSAAAALVGVPAKQIRPVLAHLARAHLVNERYPGRYVCHELLRTYAAELAGSEESEVVRRAALGRLIRHYARMAAIADRLIAPYRHPGRPAARFDVVLSMDCGEVDQPFGDIDTALAWFATEYQVLLLVIEQAFRCGFHQEVCELAWNLTSFLDRRAYWQDQAVVQRTALAAARQLGDLALEARTHRGLARAYLRLGRYEDAAHELRQALGRFEALGDDAGRASAELSLADLCERRGRIREALAHAERAFALFGGAGYQPGQANALNAVGWCHARLGDHARALADCARALRLQRLLGDHRGAAYSWDSIGYANHGLARYRPAVRSFQEALALFREVGDRFAEAGSLARLGDARQAAGDRAAGRAAWSQALTILTELGHPGATEVRARLAG